MTRGTPRSTTAHKGAGSTAAETLWMLNCYDRWSATPRDAEACGNPGTSPVGTAAETTLGET